MYELKKEEFSLCNHLKKDVKQLEVRAILDGNNPGRIFVDQKDNPKSGLVWKGNLDGFGFIGDHENQPFLSQLNSFLDEVIADEAKDLNLVWFEGYGVNENWVPALNNVFQHRDIILSKQLIYQLINSEDCIEHHLSPESPYELIQLNKDNLNTYLKQPFVHEKIQEFWETPHDFLKKGIGYGILYEGQVVSLCFSAFISDQVHGIDIETFKEHRGNNLGKIVASAFAKECIKNNITPYWDCMEVNKPSRSVAEGIGLKLTSDYTLFEYKF